MYFVIIGLTIGIIIGGFLQLDIPAFYSRYTAVAILGVLDSLFGAIRSEIENKFDTTVFVSGLLFNILLAVIITYFGDKLNLDLYLAILIVFTMRIFQNIGIIKSIAVDNIKTRKRHDNSTS